MPPLPERTDWLDLDDEDPVHRSEGSGSEMGFEVGAMSY